MNIKASPPGDANFRTSSSVVDAWLDDAASRRGNIRIIRKKMRGTCRQGE
jgi:hypothetical protein